MSDRGVALVLSGGGAKTAAHLGAVRAVGEAGLVPVRYVATSMGAVIAAGLAAGTTPEVLLDRLAAVGPGGIVREPLALVAGCSPVRCSGRLRFVGRSRPWCRPAASPN
jgi:hypothetical protein